MKIKTFMYDFDVLPKKVQEWLDENPYFEVQHIAQSLQHKTLLLTVFYTERPKPGMQLAGGGMQRAGR